MTSLEPHIGGNSPELREGVLDVFAPTLSPERVTRGEIDALHAIATNLLELDGVQSTVNGIPATVTRQYVETTIGDQEYFARVYRFERKPDQVLDPQPAIIFDETRDVAGISRNHLAVRFSDLAGAMSVVVDNDQLDPEVDRPEHVNAVQSVLNGLSQQVQASQIEKKRAQETEKAQRSRARRRTAARAGRIAVRVGVGVATGAAVVGAVWGAIYGISKIDLPEDVPFDERGYSLDNGSRIQLEQTRHPAFSSDLLEDDDLEDIDVPELGEGAGSDAVPEILENSDTLRQITITSSEDGRDCKTVGAALEPGTEVLAWTDFTDDNGVSRADELDVTNNGDSIRVCWTGEETGDYDDPRVVLAPSIVQTPPAEQPTE